MLLVKNEDAIAAKAAQLDLYQRKIAATTDELNKLDAQGRHIRPSSAAEGFDFISPAELTKMSASLAAYQQKVLGLKGVLAELKGEKTPEQLAAEKAVSAKKSLDKSATETLGILEEIDAKIKAYREQQQQVTAARGQAAAAAEIQRIGRDIKEQEDLKKKLLGEADDKEAERKRKALEKQAQQEHAQALKNLHDLQASAQLEQARLRAVDSEADQQALNQLDAHYAELIKKAQALGQNSKLTEQERREAIATIDLLADSQEEARENLKQKQREKRAAEALKFENEHALARANLRILLAKREEQQNPAELQNALIAKVELERDIELQNVKLTEEQRQLIIQESEDKIAGLRAGSAEKQNQQLLKALSQFQQQTNQLIDSSLNFLKAQEAAALQTAEKQKNNRLHILEREKLAGTVTTEQYEAQKASIQAEYDRKASLIKREQFEAEQVASIAKATIDASVGIVKALAEGGPFAGPALAAFIGTLAAVQIATIISQPVPRVRRGRLHGQRLHRPAAPEPEPLGRRPAAGRALPGHRQREGPRVLRAPPPAGAARRGPLG